MAPLAPPSYVSACLYAKVNDLPLVQDQAYPWDLTAALGKFHQKCQNVDIPIGQTADWTLVSVIMVL